MDGHKISKKNKIQIVVIAVLYALLLTVLFCLIAEDRGFWPGKLLDRPFADSYVKKNYPDVRCRLVRSGYFNEVKNDFGIDYDSRGYRYVYEVLSVKDGAYGGLSAGDTFSVEAYNFKVTYDEIFDRYTFDSTLEASLSEWLLDVFKEYADLKGLDVTPVQVFAEAKVRRGLYTGIDDGKVLEHALTNGALRNAAPVLHVKGAKTGFEEYKDIIAPLLGIFAEGGLLESEELHPAFLRIIYHYEEDGKDVAAFESSFQGYQLKYTESMIAGTSNLHFKILLTGKETRQVRVYTIIRSIYIWVILAAIAVLLGFWAYRRIRRLAAFN